MPRGTVSDADATIEDGTVAPEVEEPSEEDGIAGIKLEKLPSFGSADGTDMEAEDVLKKTGSDNESPQELRENIDVTLPHKTPLWQVAVGVLITLALVLLVLQRTCGAPSADGRRGMCGIDEPLSDWEETNETLEVSGEDRVTIYYSVAKKKGSPGRGAGVGLATSRTEAARRRGRDPLCN